MSRYTSLKDGVPYAGIIYKDIIGLTLNTTTIAMTPTTYNLLVTDVNRFDAFVENLYADSELDYALLWLNGKSCCFDLATNDTLNIYDRVDMYRITNFK